MPCLLAIFGGLFPRLATLFVWIARPTYFNAAFGGNWFLALLGILVLPFTTLMWILLWTPGIGITGFDWFWLVLAVMLDLSSLFSSAWVNRERVPGMARM